MATARTTPEQKFSAKSSTRRQAYNYKALEADQIRLLKLLAGERDEPLQANLITYRLLQAPQRLDEVEEDDEDPKKKELKEEERLRKNAEKSLKNEEDRARPQYEALSYFWGPPQPEGKESDYSINIIENYDTFRKGIRQNLHSALKRLRDPEHPRWLWVDALCLWQDQKPEQAGKEGVEKSVQIPRMHLIYNKASHVCIWLGEGDHSSDDAMKFVSQVEDIEKFYGYFTDPPNVRLLDNFARLLRRDWFGRRWIVQELAVARTATIYCGNEKVAWRKFADAVSLFSSQHVDLKKIFQESKETNFHPQYLGDVRQMGAYRLVHIANNFFRKSDEGEILDQLVSLEEVVSMLATFDSQDPKDIIYAVLSLSNDATASAKAKSYYTSKNPQKEQFFEERLQKIREKQPTEQPSALRRSPSAYKLFAVFDKSLNQIQGSFRADKVITIKYESTVFDVYKDFMEHTVTQSKSLDILCRPWAANKDKKGMTIQLPSWMSKKSSAIFGLQFNRAYTRLRSDLLVGDAGPGGTHYKASKGIAARWDYRDHEVLAQSLVVHGFVVGNISRKCGVARGGVIPPQWCTDWEALRESDKERERDKRVPASSFWRTLVADRGPEGQKKPPSYYESACEYAFGNRIEQEDLNTRDMIESISLPHVKEYLERVQAVTWTRRLVLVGDDIQGQRLGLVPEFTLKSDLVCILHGCSVPVILRRHDTLILARKRLAAVKTQLLKEIDRANAYAVEDDASKKAMPDIIVDESVESRQSKEVKRQLKTFGGEPHGNPYVEDDPLFAADRENDERQHDLRRQCAELESAIKELHDRLQKQELNSSRFRSVGIGTDDSPNDTSANVSKSLDRVEAEPAPVSTNEAEEGTNVNANSQAAPASTNEAEEGTNANANSQAAPASTNEAEEGTNVNVSSQAAPAATPGQSSSVARSPNTANLNSANASTTLQVPEAGNIPRKNSSADAALSNSANDDFVPKNLQKSDRAGSQAWRNQPLPRYYYEFIGECYIHGLMDGEAMKLQTARPQTEELAQNLEEFDPPQRRTQVFWLR